MSGTVYEVENTGCDSKDSLCTAVVQHIMNYIFLDLEQD